MKVRIGKFRKMTHGNLLFITENGQAIVEDDEGLKWSIPQESIIPNRPPVVGDIVKSTLGEHNSKFKVVAIERIDNGVNYLCRSMYSCGSYNSRKRYAYKETELEICYEEI